MSRTPNDRDDRLSHMSAAEQERLIAAQREQACRDETNNSCREIARIMANELAETCFQPIIDLRTGEVFAYEALSRGPEDSRLHMPRELFAAAEQCAARQEMDVMCCALSVQRAGERLDKPVFINIGAGHIEECLARIAAGQVRDKTVVLEINEDELADASLREQRAFALAVDNVGSGFSSPEMLARVRPEFIKIGRSLIGNIGAISYHEALLAAMIDYGHSIKAKIIAVGVETQEELQKIIGLGVDFAQGFLLAPPAPQTLAATDGIAGYIRSVNLGRVSEDKLSEVYGVTIGDITQFTPVVVPSTLVSEIQTLLSGQRGQGVVVLEGQKPVGLVMSHSLYYRLGSHYGVALYYRRAVERVMDRQPLVVDAGMSLEATATMAMARGEEKLYDLIIVIKEGNFLGTVSIIHLLKHLTSLQIRSAANANPLTGLAGNLLIEEKLKASVSQQASFAVLYVDLDNFKAFNDKYGFEHGDKVLLLTASLLNSCLSAHSGQAPDFLGHIGGDDFVVITQQDKAQVLCEAIIREFDAAIRTMYPPDDLKVGYIAGHDRKGREENYPIMTVSIAVIDNVERKFDNYLEIGEVAAQLKKKAKQLPGSVWVDDRRRR